MKGVMVFEHDLNLKATDLRLGLPGTYESEKDIVSNTKNNKRALPQSIQDSGSKENSDPKQETTPTSKEQIVGWPPVRSYRKNNSQMKKTEADTGIYVKVSMDGAPYLRKINLKAYNGYPDLLKSLEIMFKHIIGDYSEREGYKGSEYAPAYEDKDGDLMLVGDVPWDMFISSCKRLRLIKGPEVRGLGCGM